MGDFRFNYILQMAYSTVVDDPAMEFEDSTIFNDGAWSWEPNEVIGRPPVPEAVELFNKYEADLLRRENAMKEKNLRAELLRQDLERQRRGFLPENLQCNASVSQMFDIAVPSTSVNTVSSFDQCLGEFRGVTAFASPTGEVRYYSLKNGRAPRVKKTSSKSKSKKKVQPVVVPLTSEVDLYCYENIDTVMNNLLMIDEYKQ